MYYLIYVLFFIIAILIVFILKQNKRYDEDILSKNRQISLVTEQCNYYMEECKNLKEVIEVNNSILDGLMPKPKIELESLGFEVIVALSGKEVVKRIKNGENYDIIFSNNIYRNGTGQECLKDLKQIEGFNTPVVVHTLTENKRDYFVNEIRI